jgi:asparagine synthase (glutamine-hydrolysing)
MGFQPIVFEFYEKPVVKIDYEDAKIEVERLLKSACNYRMIADVPVGVFLSGGIDSSAITAILQIDRAEKLKTFTIGFEHGNDEAPFAKKIAGYLQTDHTEVYCTAKDALQIIPELSFYFDEPFADDSAVPTMLLSRLARKDVKVALSADGGDETFAGYQRYNLISKYSRQVGAVPKAIKKATKSLAKNLDHILPEGLVYLRHRLSGVSRSIDLTQYDRIGMLYEQMNNLPEYYIKNLILKPENSQGAAYRYSFKNFSDKASIPLAIDLVNYLQDDILTKIDRSTMSVGLEGRSPLLDHRLLEYVAQLPYTYKNDGTTMKRILKDILFQYIPKELLNRPKAGFDPPILYWLRNDCRDLLEYFLSEECIKKSGLLNEKFVSVIKKLFIAEKLHYSQIVWRILQFQMWYEQWM